MLNQEIEIRHEQVFSVQKLSVLREKSFSLSAERCEVLHCSLECLSVCVVSCSHRNSGTYVFGLLGPGILHRLGTFYTVPKSSRNFLPPLVLHKWE